MRAIVCEQLGDPTAQGVLRLAQDQPAPQLQPGFIRIKVTAASLNFPDMLQVKGEYQVKPPLPFIPGAEVSGFVSEVGPKVKSFKVGDLVCAVNQGGAFAEEAVTHFVSAWHIPNGMDAASAAAVPVAFGTAHLALVHRARVSKGHTALVLGASGGVGTAAIQICKLLGARVVAVTSSSSKVEYLRSLGADAVVDASQARPDRPLSKLIKQAAPKGVDVVFDPVGGKQLNEALKTVKWGAQYLVIGFAEGSIPSVKTNLLLVKNTTMHGVFWGSYMQHNPALLRASMDETLQWVAEGKIKVHISHRYPLERVPEAMAAMLDRQVQGKVLLTMGTEETATGASTPHSRL